MVSQRAAQPLFAPKWTPHGFLQRFRNVVRTPADFFLALQIGYFIFRAPAEMRRATNLPRFLARLRARPHRRRSHFGTEFERLVRLRGAWLNLPFFRRSNTCYVRALTLYRFLDGRPHSIGIRFGIEAPVDGRGRLRGHAWVTIDDRILEGPDAVILGRVREVPIVSAPPT